MSANQRISRNLIVVPHGELSIEFANTVAWHGSTPSESLHTCDDVLVWLASAKALPAHRVAELRKWFEARPADAAMLSSDAIEVRETLYRLLHCVASASAPASEDLRRLNRALSDAPLGYSHSQASL
jgi:predicted RNA-binding Zn ribbon-like protein